MLHTESQVLLCLDYDRWFFHCPSFLLLEEGIVFLCYAICNGFIKHLKSNEPVQNLFSAILCKPILYVTLDCGYVSADRS